MHHDSNLPLALMCALLFAVSGCAGAQIPPASDAAYARDFGCRPPAATPATYSKDADGTLTVAYKQCDHWPAGDWSEIKYRCEPGGKSCQLEPRLAATISLARSGPQACSKAVAVRQWRACAALVRLGCTVESLPGYDAASDSLLPDSNSPRLNCPVEAGSFPAELLGTAEESEAYALLQSAAKTNSVGGSSQSLVDAALLMYPDSTDFASMKSAIEATAHSRQEYETNRDEAERLRSKGMYVAAADKYRLAADLQQQDNASARDESTRLRALASALDAFRSAEGISYEDLRSTISGLRLFTRKWHKLESHEFLLKVKARADELESLLPLAKDRDEAAQVAVALSGIPVFFAARVIQWNDVQFFRTKLRTTPATSETATFDCTYSMRREDAVIELHRSSFTYDEIYRPDCQGGTIRLLATGNVLLRFADGAVGDGGDDVDPAHLKILLLTPSATGVPVTSKRWEGLDSASRIPAWTRAPSPDSDIAIVHGQAATALEQDDLKSAQTLIEQLKKLYPNPTMIRRLSDRVGDVLQRRHAEEIRATELRHQEEAKKRADAQAERRRQADEEKRRAADAQAEGRRQADEEKRRAEESASKARKDRIESGLIGAWSVKIYSRHLTGAWIVSADGQASVCFLTDPGRTMSVPHYSERCSDGLWSIPRRDQVVIDFGGVGGWLFVETRTAKKITGSFGLYRNGSGGAPPMPIELTRVK
jgi:hypothetical protein